MIIYIFCVSFWYITSCLSQNIKDDINKRQSIHMNSVPRGSWASSIFDLKSSQGDQLLPHLFDQVSYEQIDEDNRKCRQENREDTLFSLFPGEEEVNPCSVDQWLWTHVPIFADFVVELMKEIKCPLSIDEQFLVYCIA